MPTELQRDNFFSWYYRLGVFIWRRFRVRDLLSFLLGCIAVALAVNGFSLNPGLSFALGAIYLSVALGLFIHRVSTRHRQDELESQIIWGLFDLMSERIFQADDRIRFTLLCSAPFRPNNIIPCYRYRLGGDHPIRDAQRSRVRYERGWGIAGKAWSEPHKIHLFPFPEFPSRLHMEAYYAQRLKIPAAVARNISDYMTETRALLAAALLTSRGRLLGVLSIDFQAEVSVADGGLELSKTNKLTVKGSKGRPDFEVDSYGLQLLMQSLRSVLESHREVEER